MPSPAPPPPPPAVTASAEHELDKKTTLLSTLEANKKNIATATSLGVAALGALYAAGKTNTGKQAIGQAAKKLEDAVSTRYKVLSKSVQKVLFNMKRATTSASKTKDPATRASTLSYMATRAIKDLQTALVKSEDPVKYERAMYDQDVLLVDD